MHIHLLLPMKEATEKERDLIINILTNSFDDNQSVNYIVNPDHKRQQRIKSLMAYSFDICSIFGKVYLNDDNTGCALIMYPHKKRTTLKAISLDIKLLFKSIGVWRAGKAMSRESQIKSRYPKEPFYYLWFIAIDKNLQHRGHGSALLEEIIKDAENQNLPILLETSTVKNIPWYNRYKFEIYDRIEFSYTLHMLKRA